MESTTVVPDSQAAFAPIVDHEADRSTESEEITILFYENEVPPFVEAEMERLYENVYTSLARLRIYDHVRNASTYVVRKGGKAITVFLFRREQGEVKVLNEQIKIDEEEIRRFTHAIFATFKSVNVISFYAIQTEIRRLPFPHQRCYCLSDIILNLPATAEEYLASLGKNMRANIKRYMNKLVRSFPLFCYEVYAKEEVSEQHIRDIIKLNRARMAGKHKVSFNDEEETERIINLARVCGLVGVATIDGRVCAGVICYRVGVNYFMHVIAHDPAYDHYSLGMLCCYLSICESIARGGKEYRFMESTHRYKFDFLGVWLGFDCLAVYRSRAHFLLNGGRILKMAFRAYARQARLWLLLAERRDNFTSRVAARYVHRLRNLKRSGDVFFAGRK